MTELYTQIKEELTELAEPQLARFTQKLLRRPGEEELSGTAALLCTQGNESH